MVAGEAPGVRVRVPVEVDADQHVGAESVGERGALAGSGVGVRATGEVGADADRREPAL